MEILKILSENLRRGSRTRSPQDAVDRPAGLRGTLVHETHLCVGCRSCAYVCSPGAITLAEPRAPGDVARGLAATWRYFAGQCTFCGRCVEYCPTHALSLSTAAPPVTGDQNEHHIEHQIEYHPCKRCGRPIILLPGALLAQLYHGVETTDFAAMRDLCEGCRSRVTGERLKNALVGRRDG